MKNFRKILFTLLLFSITTALLQAQNTTGTYSFDRTSHDYGTLKTNETGTAVFKLTNTGTTPLILLDAKVSCNCAKIQWPRQPIPPGGSAEIIITYKDRETGAFYKVAEIVSNGTPRRTELRLKGTIEKDR